MVKDGEQTHEFQVNAQTLQGARLLGKLHNVVQAAEKVGAGFLGKAVNGRFLMKQAEQRPDLGRKSVRFLREAEADN